MEKKRDQGGGRGGKGRGGSMGKENILKTLENAIWGPTTAEMYENICIFID